jgi:hypothetical protein
MQLLVPDILSEAQGLSANVTAPAFALGFLIWLLGWRGHRFWIVLGATICAGLIGLDAGPSWGTQRLVAGLLLAVAAGALALALVRVVAFAAGGAAGWLIVHALAPQWSDPLVCFLGGGIFGLLLFRLWMMTLTSGAGALLMGYSGLCLAAKFGSLDAVALAEKQTLMLNVACAGVALLGVVSQFFLDRQLHRASRRRRYQMRQRGLIAEFDESTSWWNRPDRSLRRVG